MVSFTRKVTSHHDGKKTKRWMKINKQKMVIARSVRYALCVIKKENDKCLPACLPACLDEARMKREMESRMQKEAENRDADASMLFLRGLYKM